MRRFVLLYQSLSKYLLEEKTTKKTSSACPSARGHSLWPRAPPSMPVKLVPVLWKLFLL